MEHQRKDDIDATRGGFELPINSKMADIGTFRAARLAASLVEECFQSKELNTHYDFGKYEALRGTAKSVSPFTLETGLYICIPMLKKRRKKAVDKAKEEISR